METKKWMIVVIGFNDDAAVWLETIEYVSGTELQVQAELEHTCKRAIEASEEEAWQDYLKEPLIFLPPNESYPNKEALLEENPIDYEFEANYVEYTKQKFRIL